MGQKKRRRRKPSARASRVKTFAESILAGVISGLIVEAILELLNK